MGIISAVLILCLLIFFHELGHFLVAKFSGVLVEKFSIGFGPVLFSFKKGETEYALSAIPLGGFVKMYGENPFDEVEDSLKERSFAHKPLMVRSAIVFAGPLANILLAILLYMIVFMAGTPKYLAVIGEVMEKMPAKEAGVLKGDKVVAVNGKALVYWDDMSEIINENAGENVPFTIERNGEKFDLYITPKLVKDKTIFGEEVKVGRIGVYRGDVFEYIHYGPGEAVLLAAEQSYNVTKLMIMGIVKIFQNILPADNIGGPIMIFQMAKETAATGFLNLLAFMAAISLNLAILNLLPIPILDGGHLFFYLIEAVIRRPVSMKIREYGQMVGLFLILSLMAFAFYNDIMRFFK